MFGISYLELFSIYFDKWGRSPAESSGGGIGIASIVAFLKYFSSPLILLLEMLCAFLVICLIYLQVEGAVKRKRRRERLEKRERRK